MKRNAVINGLAIVAVCTAGAFAQNSPIQKDQTVHALSASADPAKTGFPTPMEAIQVLVRDTNGSHASSGDADAYDYEWASNDPAGDGLGYAAAGANGVLGQWDETTGVGNGSTTPLPYPRSPGFMQAVEFDNRDGIFHNPAGNLLMQNFGASWTGSQIWNYSTNGSFSQERLWSIKNQTSDGLGPKQGNPDRTGNGEGYPTQCSTYRGAGLSVSPDNTKVSFALTYDSSGGDANLDGWYVCDYNAGATPGTGSGATISGPRKTDDYLNSGSTLGTSWINNQCAVLFDGTNIHAWNISNTPAGTDHAGGTGGAPNGAGADMVPTVDSTNHYIAAHGNVHAPQYTDILYNPAIDPEHIYTMVTDGGYNGWAQKWSYDPETGDIALKYDINLTGGTFMGEPREFGMDSEGNLIFVSYAGSGSDDIVGVIPDALNDANWVTDADVAGMVDGQYASYHGMDVASGEFLKGDGDLDLDVDGDDFGTWASNNGTMTGADHKMGDWDADGDVDGDDFGLWAGMNGFSPACPTEWTPQAVTQTPEPGTLAVLGIGGLATLIRRKRQAR